ncbi:hypothetical protein Neosp_014819 [[Neocosmospora] mangrovei]
MTVSAFISTDTPLALYAGILSFFTLAVVGLLSLRRERLPNAEFLRVVDKPGRGGQAEDVEAFMKNSLGAIMKGYNEYSKHGRHFLLRTPTQVYLMAPSTMLEEIRKIPDNMLSQPAAANIIFQIKHTFHSALLNDYYHFDVVRKSLTQNLPRIIGDLASETSYSFGAELGQCEDWTHAVVFQVCTALVTRVANRMMVGPELCRNKDLLHYSATYTKATFDAAAMLRNVPAILKPLVMRFNTSHRSQQEVARRILVPVIRERLSRMHPNTSSGDKQNKPNDALTDKTVGYKFNGFLTYLHPRNETLKSCSNA